MQSMFFGLLAATAGGGGGGGGSLLLDGLTVSPLIAVSTRKLRGAYAGSAIRVRRSSDNTEQDIGFTGSDLDTTALLAFCGAGDGFVTKMYNQVSGASVDFAQTTTGAQPQIVSSGSVVLFKTSGKPAPLYSAASILGADITLGTTDNIGVSGVANITGTTGDDARIITYQATGQGADWNNTASFELECKQATSASGFIHAYRNSQGGSVTTAFPIQWSAYTSSANQRIDFSVNGTAYTSGASGQGNFGSTGHIQMGTSSAAFGWAGPLPELIVQGTYNSADLTTIAADQKTYWGTP